MRTVGIATGFITLGAALKLAGVISTGGQAKQYLATAEVHVNGLKENRRGRKLFPGDVVSVPDGEFQIAARGP